MEVMSEEKIDNMIMKLTAYGLYTGLIENSDVVYIINQYIGMLGIDEIGISAKDVIEFTEKFSEDDILSEDILSKILDGICYYVVKKGFIENQTVYRDLFDTKLMGVMTDRPSSIMKKFNDYYIKDPVSATDYFYEFSKDTNYIRRDRIKRDVKWVTSTEYGNLDITINLSKPEKDPKTIAMALKMKKSSYPMCQLCMENEGYFGRVNYPARENHRIIKIDLGDEKWGFQYSPYVYYNEHCIVLSDKHEPMKIDRKTFERLLNFVSQFPHYFIGSNADLRIVGGSILTHNHFQGGKYDFAMAKAETEYETCIDGYEGVKLGIVKWPMSCIRLSGENIEKIIDLADKILIEWREYSDESVNILAYSDGENHNTITPIARKNGTCYELDLVLRNNRTSPEHPIGIFHPHENLHHIKKENIGLIEVMGLAVLTARLKSEMAELKEAILEGRPLEDNEEIRKHESWMREIIQRHDEINSENVDSILKEEIGKVFLQVLMDAV